MKQPIFISGLRKSGTSMVKNLLDNHPALFMFPPNEFHFFTFTHYYNLGNFLRTLALPEAVEHWSLTTLREKLIKIGAKVVRHGHYTRSPHP